MPALTLPIKNWHLYKTKRGHIVRTGPTDRPDLSMVFTGMTGIGSILCYRVFRKTGAAYWGLDVKEGRSLVEDYAGNLEPFPDDNVVRLLTILANVYQILGAMIAPTHILDVLSDPLNATEEQIEAMLPFEPLPEVEYWKHRFLSLQENSTQSEDSQLFELAKAAMQGDWASQTRDWRFNDPKSVSEFKSNSRSYVMAAKSLIHELKKERDV